MYICIFTGVQLHPPHLLVHHHHLVQRHDHIPDQVHHLLHLPLLHLDHQVLADRVGEEKEI